MYLATEHNDLSWKSSFVLDQTFICSLIYDKSLFCLFQFLIFLLYHE